MLFRSGETAESPCTRATTAACRGAGFEPTAAVKTDDYPVAIAAVAARVAVAIVPRLALTAAHPRVVALPILGGDKVVRRLSVLRRAARPSALLDEAVEQLIAAFRREPLCQLHEVQSMYSLCVRGQAPSARYRCAGGSA